MVTTTYFDKDTIEKIKERAELADILPDFVHLKHKGNQLRGNCPSCNADKFEYNEKKNIYKCWNGCEKGGSTAIGFLMDVVGQEYMEAINYLSDRYNIKPEAKTARQKKNGNRKNRFRDLQMKESGIPNKYQQYVIRIDNNTEMFKDRYESATIDRYWNVVAGDDMILNYLDIHGQPMTFQPKGSKRKEPIIRVRWANPELHLNKDGKSMKYQSRPGSSSALWIPNQLISSFAKEEIIETLVVVEGEKKADRLCLAGVPAVGISGIHNFSSSSTMPHEFERLIKVCAISNVIFLLDSDWQDLSIHPGKPVDSRPKTFASAVIKFRNYFYGFMASGYNLRIFFAHGTDPVYKGIDDVIMRQIEGDDEKIREDFAKAINAKENGGDYVKAYDITEASSYQIKMYWHLHSNPAFLQHYHDELSKLPNFKLGKLLWRYNEEGEEFELAQKILPHERYWEETWKDNAPKPSFSFYYQGALQFLYNRGYGLFEYKPHSYRFVLVNGRVVEETQPISIRHFMLDFTKEIDNKPVLELLLRGGKQYFGPDNLHNLPRRQLPFQKADRHVMYFFFQNVYWKITADSIEQRPLSELEYYIWKNQVIEFEPKQLDNPLAEVERNGEAWNFDFSDEFTKADIAGYYLCTSNFFWNKSQHLVEDKEGNKFYAQKEKPEAMTDEERQFFYNNLAAKMLAAGYVMHDFLNYSCMKAIVCMDGAESAVGQSQGGTGKSIWGKQFQHMVPMSIIDGKKKNLEDDNHLYENVDERTKVILYDDVRVNFNFEFLFSQITTGLTVNPKGEKRYEILPPKFIIATNHALNGDGNSFDRRQYTITFSDYFNGHRTVGDEFGHQLFHEWDYDQWNFFYNWMAQCVQLYLKHGLVDASNDGMIKRRKLRQEVGESFIMWASLVFDTETDASGDWLGIYLNKRVEKMWLMEKYLEANRKAVRYMDDVLFKKKIKAYAQYAGLTFNPNRDPKKNGDRIKSNGDEYFILADHNYQQQMYSPGIKTDENLMQWRTRNQDILPSSTSKKGFRVERDHSTGMTITEHFEKDPFED